MKRFTLLAITLLITGCALMEPESNPTVLPVATDPAAPSSQEEVQSDPTDAISSGGTDTLVPDSPAESVADVIFYGGSILTMDEDSAVAQSVAIKENQILAVGSEEAILAFAGTQTQMIDLDGRVLVPGFIDSHVHRIGDRGLAGIESAEASIQLAIEQGYTSINEMFVNQERLDELRNLDQSGSLRLRVNAYLPLNYDQPKFGSWYQAYQPGFEYSPYLRIAGLKIFMDHGWGKGELLWTQEELDQTLGEASQLGWQIAAHSVGEPAHTLLLNSIQRIVQNNPDSDLRFRIEHVIVISDQDVKRMADLNVLASIQLHAPNTWSTAFDDFYPEVSADLQPHFTRYRDLANAGILLIGSSDWPYAELEDGFGSPMKMLYQAVTRVGTQGRPPEDWMIGQEIPLDLALRALTINGAYGTFEEQSKGSIEPGKFADLVILSGNPLDTPIDEVPNIQVLMTMVGGKVEWCAAGSEAFCPTGTPPVNESGSIPFGFLDLPASEEIISGSYSISGWALVDDNLIKRVEIYLDGEYIGDAIYGTPRPDVAGAYPGRVGEPNFGYSFELNTLLYANGPHTLSVIAVSRSGSQSHLVPEILHFSIQN